MGVIPGEGFPEGSLWDESLLRHFLGFQNRALPKEYLDRIIGFHIKHHDSDGVSLRITQQLVVIPGEVTKGVKVGIEESH